jgi:allantoate deiminase
MAHPVIERCIELAQFTEEPEWITRTFLSEPFHQVHARVRQWMEAAGMSVTVDSAGNIRGRYVSASQRARTLYIGSHLDTVPKAGAFDGILGVMMGISLVESLAGRALPFHIEVVGFSEEEGVRFGVPFIGSRALIGDVDEALLNRLDRDDVSVRDAIRHFGLDPAQVPDAAAEQDALAYLEVHIEQGPVLEKLGLPLGVVDSIVGQTRLNVAFKGKSNHAGTTPMNLRHDALAAAAEWICGVENTAKKAPSLVATVGRLEVKPGAGNVIAGWAGASLDVRHSQDWVRQGAADRIKSNAAQIADARGLSLTVQPLLDQPAVAMDARLTSLLEHSVEAAGHTVHRMPSGAGHDAMILARKMPVAMLFLRSPGGISHHPEESVLSEDVEAACAACAEFLKALEATYV